MGSEKDPPAGPCEVGYRRPPESSRFTSTRQPKRHRRAKKPHSNSVLDVLNEEIHISKNGRKIKMSSYEIAVRKLVEKAVRESHLDNACEFLELCKQHNLIEYTSGPQSSGVLMVPRSWSWDEWMSMFNRYGPPPWPGPRSGTVDPNGTDSSSKRPPPERSANAGQSQAAAGADPTKPVGYCNPPRASQFKAGVSGNPKGRPSHAKTQKAIVAQVAFEKHSVPEGDGRVELTILELILRVIRLKSHEGNRKAFRTQGRLLDEYGYKSSATKNGFLIVSEPETSEEWGRKTAEQQRQYREK
jgi:hypothetical protein